LVLPHLLHLHLLHLHLLHHQVFEGIFQKIKLPKKSRDGSERHRRIKGLMLYLARERTAEAALGQLLGLFQETVRCSCDMTVLKIS
jgi:hypothetical protein